MTEDKAPHPEKAASETAAKPEPEGFFKRIFTKMDTAMKAKAEAQSDNACCSDDQSDGKGGKCC
ncbi:MAG: hypothetical protein GWO81_05740 [Verrucomicrobia bacterium]|nr:hypothetical protein [Verrucomicrobiota bacterium]